jgi:hypothetical protein
MSDLSNYHSQEQIIAELKKELRDSKAEVKKLTARLEKKKTATTRQKILMQARTINIAHAIGRGHLAAQIIDDLRVCTATVTAVNKLIN